KMPFKPSLHPTVFRGFQRIRPDDSRQSNSLRLMPTPILWILLDGAGHKVSGYLRSLFNELQSSYVSNFSLYQILAKSFRETIGPPRFIEFANCFLIVNSCVHGSLSMFDPGLGFLNAQQAFPNFIEYPSLKRMSLEGRFS